MKARNDLIFDFLMDYFGLAKDIISEHEGVIDKFIGDGIMSIFGLGGSDDDGTESSTNAINAAVKLKESFHEEVWDGWKKKFQSHAEESIGDIYVKCGINTGECLTGWVGVGEAKSFTALGNTVNIASRMEGLAQKDQIVVSERTARLIEEIFVVRKIGTSNLNLERESDRGGNDSTTTK